MILTTLLTQLIMCKDSQRLLSRKGRRPSFGFQHFLWAASMFITHELASRIRVPWIPRGTLQIIVYIVALNLTILSRIQI